MLASAGPLRVGHPLLLNVSATPQQRGQQQPV
jgi:hypothetical protein